MSLSELIFATVIGVRYDDVDIIVNEEVEADIRGVLHVALKQKSDIFIDSDMLWWVRICTTSNCSCIWLDHRGTILVGVPSLGEKQTIRPPINGKFLAPIMLHPNAHCANSAPPLTLRCHEMGSNNLSGFQNLLWRCL